MTTPATRTQAAKPVEAPKPAAKPNKADEFLAQVKRFAGQPYLWGGGHGGKFTKPGPVDCSGLVSQAGNLAGINLNGVASAQQRMGKPVSLDSLKPGDLVFSGNPAHHVGVYIGNGQVMHAPHTGDVVRVTNVRPTFDNAVRVFDEAGQPLDVSDLPAPPPSSGGSPGGSPGSSGSPGGSSGGDSSSVGGNSGSRSGMSLSGSPGGSSGSVGKGGNYTVNPFDWSSLLSDLMDSGLSEEEAKEVQAKIKAGDRKGAMALLKAKGLSGAKLDKATKAVDKAPAMGAAHEKREDWFISQYGSKYNPNEDLPGLGNGNCGPTSLTMVAKAFGKINPTAAQANDAIEESRRRMGESQDEHEGTSLAGIARGAQSYGLDAKVTYNANPNTIQDELAKGRLPIIHGSAFRNDGSYSPGSGHYFVVTAIKDGKAYLNDPAYVGGPRVVTVDQLMANINARGTHGMISIAP